MKTRDFRNSHPAVWGGSIPDDWSGVKVGLLAQILDELRGIHTILRCDRTRAIPMHLERIAKNTEKRKRK